MLDASVISNILADVAAEIAGLSVTFSGSVYVGIPTTLRSEQVAELPGYAETYERSVMFPGNAFAGATAPTSSHKQPAA